MRMRSSLRRLTLLLLCCAVATGQSNVPVKTAVAWAFSDSSIQGLLLSLLRHRERLRSLSTNNCCVSHPILPILNCAFASGRRTRTLDRGEDLPRSASSDQER